MPARKVYILLDNESIAMVNFSKEKIFKHRKALLKSDPDKNVVIEVWTDGDYVGHYNVDNKYVPVEDLW